MVMVFGKLAYIADRMGGWRTVRPVCNEHEVSSKGRSSLLLTVFDRFEDSSTRLRMVAWSLFMGFAGCCFICLHWWSAGSSLSCWISDALLIICFFLVVGVCLMVGWWVGVSLSSYLLHFRPVKGVHSDWRQLCEVSNASSEGKGGMER